MLGIPSNTSVNIGLTKDYHYWKLTGGAMKFKNVTRPWNSMVHEALWSFGLQIFFENFEKHFSPPTCSMFAS